MRPRANLIVILGILLSICTYAQKGHVYVSNYQVDQSVLDSKITEIQFDNSGLAFIAGRKGMAVFDGNKWKNIETVPQNISAVKIDTAVNKIFIGLKKGIGQLIRAENGSYQFHYLKQVSKSDVLFDKIETTNKEVVFYSPELIYIVQKDNPAKIDSLVPPSGKTFSGIISRKESVYVNIMGKGFHKLNGSKLQYISTVSGLKNSIVRFSTSFNRKNILLGTNKNQIYLFDGRKFVQFAKHTEIRDFLDENILWEGIDFSGKYFAVTTLTGGCAIIDKSYGKIVNVINYQTGLPDDEIYAIARDNNKGIWLSHEHGISRCAPELPMKYYSTYPGLSGNVNDILVKNNVLYAATNDGVYKLQKADYKSIKNIPVKQSSSRNAKRKNVAPQKNRRAYIQQSITHQYVKVSNLKEKCKKLYLFGNNLIALSNYGVYEISDKTAKPIITNVYPNDIHVCDDTSIVYLAALNGVYELSYTGDKDASFNTWKKRKVLRDVQAQVHSIARDKHKNLFLGLDSKTLKAPLSENSNYLTTEQLPLPEPTEEPINLINNNGDVYFIQSTGIYVYNETKNEVLYHDIRSITTKNLQFVLGKRNAWIKEDIFWEPVAGKTLDIPSELLSIFKNTRNIYYSKKGELWLVNGTTQVLKISPSKEYSVNHNFELTVCSLKDNSDSLHVLQNAAIPHRNNAIKLEVDAPFYLRPEEVQYQYLIKGLKNYEGWSEWSFNPIVELSSVRPGKYNIIVRAKNVFGQKTIEVNTAFKILKPFWQTKTFIISASLGLVAIIVLSFYLSHRRLLRKKRILEQKVKERTAELLEEKEKTEALLLNILPKKTAEELKKYNKVTPRNYDNATVLFTDFKGFTHIAEKLTPEELVNEIDLCFKEFDNIISKYRIEKIKTIGDAYMCAGGLPTRNKYNAFDVVKAALDIRDYMLKYKEEREKLGVPFFEIRIGIHTGKVVAGVVGTRKYAYDIWGDTVNLASRMESSGEPGKVNISGDTYTLVKENFACTHRGKVQAKNKGEVDMYFVEEQIKPVKKRAASAKKTN